MTDNLDHSIDAIVSDYARVLREKNVEIDRLREALESLQNILCDPDGNPCFRGGPGDYRIAIEAFKALEAKP